MAKDGDVGVKRGSRWEVVGKEWLAWPSNGIWIVEDGRQGLISKIGEVPNPMRLASLMKYKDELCARIREFWENNKFISADSEISFLLQELTKLMEENEPAHQRFG